MVMFKRIIPMVLVFCTCLTIATPVYAETREYKNNLEEVPKLKLERNVLKEEEDAIRKAEGGIVLNDIDNRSVSINSNTPETSIKVGIGGNAYEYMSAGEVTWFSFQTVESPYYQGVYDIYSTGSTDTYAQLYKKDSNGSMVRIAYNDDSGEGSNFKFSYVLNGSTVYYVKVNGYSSSTTGSYYFNVERHVDEVSDDIGNGGSWIINGDSPIPTVNGVVYKITYLNAEDTEALYAAFNESVFSVILDWAVSESAGYAVPKIATKLGVSSGQAMLIFSLFCLGSDVANTSMKNKIWNASDGLDTGISITTENVQGSMYYDVDTWYEPMMYGAPGYLGYFDQDDIEIGR